VRVAVVCLLLAGCGRFHFGEHQDASVFGGAIDAPDGPMLAVDILPPDAGLPAGLVVWFPLDDASATNAADVISGHNGTCNGNQCPTQTAGHHGTAFLFDGMDDCIQVSDIGQFGQAKITLSLWIRQDVVDTCSPVAKPVGVTTTTDTWQIETNGGNQIMFTTTETGSSNTRVTANPNTLVIGQWHHVAATWDFMMGKALYVDGNPVGSTMAMGTLTYDNSSAWIGCDNNNGTFAERFNGAIDDVQLYNRALTLAEIQMLAAM